MSVVGKALAGDNSNDIGKSLQLYQIRYLQFSKLLV